ncbi:MAG: tetratricopeptide repeat protein [Acidobacteria bacterium]|nr:MAG: tetratricopeptide repeat protein [Acidobacteriota bacterium]
MSLPAPQTPEHLFGGQIVAISGKLALLTRRDARAIIARLGGVLAREGSARVTLVVTEDELCRAAGLPDAETLRGQYYSSKDLRGMYPLLRDDHLRYLAKCGLVRPVAGRYYSFTDLHVLKQAASDLERGIPLNAAMRELVAERQGQLTFDFQAATRSDRMPTRVLTLRPATSSPALSDPNPLETGLTSSNREERIQAANYTMAAKFFLEGAEFDDGDDPDLDAACTAYRKALMFDPVLVPALVNLANIHYERDQLVEAEALYERAIRLDADCFEAYFNLGNIHHDLARYAEAVTSYRDALAINPEYPEAHFYLAVTLEKLGRSAEARPHWKAYCELAPEGEFVKLAREFQEAPPPTQ